MNSKTDKPNYQPETMFTPIGNTRDVNMVLAVNSQPLETGYIPVNCVEMKATIDIYHIYADKFNDSTIKDEKDWYADICAVLLNRIREMEKQLHYEFEKGN